MNRISIRRSLVVWLAATVLPAGMGAQSLPLSEATIADINAAFDAGSLTAERLVELYLARIEAYDDQGPKLNAILTLNRRALETARAWMRSDAPGARAPSCTASRCCSRTTSTPATCPPPRGRSC